MTPFDLPPLEDEISPYKPRAEPRYVPLPFVTPAPPYPEGPTVDDAIKALDEIVAGRLCYDPRIIVIRTFLEKTKAKENHV